MKKLKIDEMRIKSFVTSLEETKSQTCKGGVEPIAAKRTKRGPECYQDTKYPICQWA